MKHIGAFHILEKFCKVTLSVSFAFLSIFVCVGGANGQSGFFSERNVKVEIFADIGGSLHGIAFDGRGAMYAAKNGKEIMKIDTEGNVYPFSIVEEACGYYRDGPGDAFIYDLEFGADGLLYAAAEDRVLRISADGLATIVIEKDFEGRWGACGVALDPENKIFVSYDNKVSRILPGGRESVFIDGEKTKPRLKAAVGLQFDARGENLYVCDGRRGETGRLLRFSVASDGSAGTPEIVFEKSGYRPEYLDIGDDGKIVAKGPENRDFILLGDGDWSTMLKCENSGYLEIETVAFGKNGFDENTVYGTEWFNGKIYRIDLHFIRGGLP